ncbi:hypothetical protein PR048_001063 [Dryococelus australis]|uniref:Uncharacterized protein n=1 Tax=Dryococelus australis TaxID=614101 RepID=A0ABQ9IGB7_9NEOP|nr:hypothetical protein PR048_001063 [Dryococelus australis]
MPLVGGFSQGSLVSPVLSYRHTTILTSITLSGSQDLNVKSRPNLFTQLNPYHSCVRRDVASWWGSARPWTTGRVAALRDARGPGPGQGGAQLARADVTSSQLPRRGPNDALLAPRRHRRGASAPLPPSHHNKVVLEARTADLHRAVIQPHVSDTH